MARGTQHRKRRPRTNARLAPAPASGPAERPSWEDQLFFGRLRGHAKWVFVLLALAFSSASSSSGSARARPGSATSSATSSAAARRPAPRSRRSRSRRSSIPRAPTAWPNYANKLEQDHQDDNAIAALTQYTKLRPKDQNALLELAGLYLSRATDWNTLYTNSQALTQALSPSPLLSRRSRAPPSARPSPRSRHPSRARSRASSQRPSNEYEKVIGYLSRRVGVYQKLVALPRRRGQPVLARQAAQDAGNSAVAIQAYKKFLKLAPDDSLAPTARQEIAALKAAGG